MTKPVIIALYDIQDTIPSYNHLIENYTIVKYNLTTKQQFINDMKLNPYSQAIAIFASYYGFHPIGRLWDPETIAALPHNLKTIGISAAGYDPYDLNALAQRGIKLTNVPVSETSAMDVADTALWHVLSGCRSFNYWDVKTRDVKHVVDVRDVVRNEGVDENNKQSGFAFGEYISGKPIRAISSRRAIVLGYGLIGKFVVDRLHVLGMHVDIVVTDKAKYSNDVKSNNIHNITDFNKLATNANVIVVCVPGNPETKHIINKDIIDRLNDGSVIVNIGRGSCIDHNALIDGLKSGKVGHAGLDVFEKEPFIDDYILANQNQTSITPHLGSSTYETYEYATDTNIQNIISVIQGKPCSNILN